MPVPPTVRNHLSAVSPKGGRALSGGAPRQAPALPLTQRAAAEPYRGHLVQQVVRWRPVMGARITTRLWARGGGVTPPTCRHHPVQARRVLSSVHAMQLTSEAFPCRIHCPIGTAMRCSACSRSSGQVCVRRPMIPPARRLRTTSPGVVCSRRRSDRGSRRRARKTSGSIPLLARRVQRASANRSRKAGPPAHGEHRIPPVTDRN